MVKRILYFALALAVLLSISACAPGNNRGNNRMGVRNNNGPGLERLSQENNNGVTYKDGIYTGYGDPHAKGNEAATVVIRNGKIADIDLTNVGLQGRTNNTAGTGRNNQTETRMGTGTTTPGTTGTPGVPGGGTALRDNNTKAPGNTTDNTPGTDIGTRIRTGTETIGETATDAINGVKTNLVNAMIRDQRHDVTIDNNDTTLTGTINNWKLAVKRALDQAR